MPRKSLYPYDPSSGQLEADINKFYKKGIRINGGEGWPDRLFPVEEYSYICIKGFEGDPDKLIEKSSTKILIYCKKHQFVFETTLRQLFNGSANLAVMLCKHCGSDLGFGKTLYTYQSLKELFALYPESPFSLEIPVETPELTTYKTTDSIPLRCTKNEFGTDIPCNFSVFHTVSNVVYALENPDKNGIILCQGKCDSKKKNKDKRKSLGDFSKEVASKTSKEWTLSLNQEYATASQRYWFTHKCGYEIYIGQYLLINADTNERGVHQCPCCDNYLPIKLINGRLDLFQIWLDDLTEGQLEYLSEKIPTSSTDQVLFRCRKCDSTFTDHLEKIRTSVYRGCIKCYEDGKNRQRVQAVDSGCETRRGFSVVGEFLSVDEPCDWTSESGEMYRGTLIELCKDYPVKAGGISRIRETSPIEKDSYSRKWLPYTEDEIALMHKLANTMPYSEMSKVFKRSTASIKRQFNKLGIRNDLRANYKRLTSLNDRVFNDVTPESCYWAGLIAADGCLNKNNRYLSIELQGKDELHLGKLLKYLESDGKITYRTVKTVEGRNLYAALNLSSTEIINALQRNFNLTPAKSITLEPPVIEDVKSREAFMLGLFDGDGDIARNVDGSLVVGLTTASLKIAYWYQEEIKRILGKSEHTITHRINEKGSKHYHITINTQEANRLMKKLYSSVDVYLERKFLIFRK